MANTLTTDDPFSYWTDDSFSYYLRQRMLHEEEERRRRSTQRFNFDYTIPVAEAPKKKERKAPAKGDRLFEIVSKMKKKEAEELIKAVDRTVDAQTEALRASHARLLAVVEAMANFDGRNNNSALKKMAREAIEKENSHD